MTKNIFINSDLDQTKHKFEWNIEKLFKCFLKS